MVRSGLNNNMDRQTAWYGMDRGKKMVRKEEEKQACGRVRGLLVEAIGQGV